MSRTLRARPQIDGARAAAYKGMYRLALTQRELLGTDVLLHLAEEEARANSSST